MLDYNIVFSQPRTQAFEDIYDEAIEYDDLAELGDGVRYTKSRRPLSEEAYLANKAMSTLRMKII